MGAAIGMMLSGAGAGGGGPTDPFFSNVVLLMHCDGANGSTTFVDSSSLNHPFVHDGSNNAHLTTAIKKFGTASLDMSTTSTPKWVLANTIGTEFQFGAGKFTLEAWVNFTAAPGGNTWAFVAQWGGTNQSWYLGMLSGQICLVYSTTGTNFFTVGAAWTPTLNTWYHVACDRDALNVVRVYVNGVVVASATVTASFFATAQQVGAGTDAALQSMLGYVDDVRVTKGVARYGGAFTPPTAAFPDS